MARIKRISRYIIRLMPGRITFTTTASPVLRRAACTCATEADASGADSNSLNACSTGSPIACSIIPCASSPGKGGTLSSRVAKGSTHSSASKSRRVANNWPNLTNTGPRSISACFTRWGSLPRTGTK